MYIVVKDFKCEFRTEHHTINYRVALKYTDLVSFMTVHARERAKFVQLGRFRGSNRRATSMSSNFYPHFRISISFFDKITIKRKPHFCPQTKYCRHITSCSPRSTLTCTSFVLLERSDIFSSTINCLPRWIFLLLLLLLLDTIYYYSSLPSSEFASKEREAKHFFQQQF